LLLYPVEVLAADDAGVVAPGVVATGRNQPDRRFGQEDRPVEVIAGGGDGAADLERVDASAQLLEHLAEPKGALLQQQRVGLDVGDELVAQVELLLLLFFVPLVEFFPGFSAQPVEEELVLARHLADVVQVGFGQEAQWEVTFLDVGDSKCARELGQSHGDESQRVEDPDATHGDRD
jgi:hypothetical protein